MARRRALALALLPVVAARAEQNDPRLDGQFARLHTTDDPGEAARIDAEIRSVRLRSGDEGGDRMIDQGSLAVAGGVRAVALAAFDRIVERRPDFVEGRNKRATLHYLMRNYGASAHDVERTLVLEPRHYGALWGMGLIQLRLDREREAPDRFGRALAIDPHLEGIRTLAERLATKVEGKPI